MFYPFFANSSTYFWSEFFSIDGALILLDDFMCTRSTFDVILKSIFYFYLFGTNFIFQVYCATVVLIFISYI